MTPSPPTPQGDAPSARALALQVLLDCRQRGAFVQEVLDRHLLCLGAAWKGIKLPGLGWKELERDLLKAQPHLHGLLAYVLGHRSLHLQRRGDAEAYFATARDAMPGETPLRRLSQAELDRLKAK